MRFVILFANKIGICASNIFCVSSVRLYRYNRNKYIYKLVRMIIIYVIPLKFWCGDNFSCSLLIRTFCAKFFFIQIENQKFCQQEPNCFGKCIIFFLTHIVTVLCCVVHSSVITIEASWNYVWKCRMEKFFPTIFIACELPNEPPTINFWFHSKWQCM